MVESGHTANRRVSYWGLGHYQDTSRENEMESVSQARYLFMSNYLIMFLLSFQNNNRGEYLHVETAENDSAEVRCGGRSKRRGTGRLSPYRFGKYATLA